MMVRSYLEWSLTASTQERAEAVGILADVYLNGELSPAERRDAEAALTLALDDPAPTIRRVLAQKLGASDRTPRPIVASLIQDLPDIASVVIANSPVVTDAALVDLLALGDPMTQIAIAQRQLVSPTVSAALAEVAAVEANVALIQNDGAEMSLSSLNRLLDRFPGHSVLREVLLERGDLPVDIRMVLVKGVADQLTGFAKDCGWLSDIRANRLAQDCTESGAIAVATEAASDDMIDLVRGLRSCGRLTPQLLLRSLLSGETRLLTASLAELAGVPHDKASGFVHARGGIGFRALYRKAGMPQRLEPAFEAALSAWHEFGMAQAEPGRLSRQMVERVLTSVAAFDDPELDKLMALLLRYQADAAREEARQTVAGIIAETAPPVMLEQDDLEQRLQEALQLEFREAA
jgi:uncharacterized protein (DUF2336 family)